MQLREVFSKKRMVAIVGVAALSLTAITPALAVEDDTTVVVTGSPVAFSVDPSVEDFDEVFISGIEQTPTADFNSFTVRDFSGTGAGWKVTVEASQFSDGEEIDPLTLALGSLELSPPTGVAPTNPGMTSPVPTIESGQFFIDDGSSYMIASAAANEGMGEYEFEAGELTLTLPGDVKAATYTSTVTITLGSAP